METMSYLSSPTDTRMFDTIIKVGEEYKTITQLITDIVNKNVGNPSGYSKFYSYTMHDPNLNQYVRHVYGIKYTKNEIAIKEVRRDFEKQESLLRDLYYQNFGCNRGTQILWKSKKSYYYGELNTCDEWYQMDYGYYEKMAYRAVELNNAENIIHEDLTLRYFGFEFNNEVSLYEYILRYKKYPIVETFMKLGLYRFILNDKAITTANESKHFRKWLYANAQDCQGLSFMHVHNSFKKNPNSNVRDYYNSLQYRITLGKEINSMDSRTAHILTQYCSLERVADYCTEHKISKATYIDYIKACNWLELNLSDTKVVFPRDFQTMHDLYTGQWYDYQAKLEADKNFKIDETMSKVADKYKAFEISNDKYVIKIARSKYDLIREGKHLNHCVGKMGYDQKQCDEDSIICFLRDITDVDTPFITIQLGLNPFSIKQIHGHNNIWACEEIDNYVRNEWLEEGKKKFKKEKENDKKRITEES